MQWLEIAEFDVQSLMGDFPLNTGKSLLECHFQNSSEIRKDFSEKQNQHAEIRKMGRLEMHAYLLSA